MTRDEEILKEAKRHYYDDINCHNAFLHGVEWADEHPDNVWYEPGKAPKSDCEPILYQNVYGNFWVSHKRKKVRLLKNWEYFVLVSQMTRWAYISDLLPKGGEK